MLSLREGRPYLYKRYVLWWTNVASASQWSTKKNVWYAHMKVYNFVRMFFFVLHLYDENIERIEIEVQSGKMLSLVCYVVDNVHLYVLNVTVRQTVFQSSIIGMSLSQDVKG